MDSPTVDHWAAVKQILSYLKGALGRGILYNNHWLNRLECFTDADWAGSKTEGPLRVTVCLLEGI